MTLASTNVTIHVVFFALVAATSPLALASVLVVLTSGRGRLNGSAFAVGFVSGQALVCFLALAIGAASFPDREQQHGTLTALFILAFGVALLVAAAWFRRRQVQPPQHHDPNPRAVAFKHRLSTLSPGTALATGAALGIGGPKRLGITVIAMATITSAGLGAVPDLALATVYVLVGTVLVWIPVVLYVVFGHRAAEWLTSAQAWISAHKDPLTFYPSAVLGVLLVVDGIVQLAT